MSSARGLALVRIGLGLTLIMSAFAKTSGGWFLTDEPLLAFLQENAANMTPPYNVFLDNFVVPNSMLFAQLIPIGEWVAGLSLTFGLFTRLGGILAAWHTLNYGLAKGIMSVEATDDRIFVVASIACAAAAAGLAWGLDGALRPAFRSNALTRWLAGIRMPLVLAPRPRPLTRTGSRAA